MDDNKKVIREFGLTTWAINNRTTVFFLTFIIVIMGMFGYKQLPKEAFPEVALPNVYVGTPYPGNTPENVEKLITEKLEKEINTISGIKKLKSNSIQDMSTIFVEFESTVLASDALREVKDAVDKAKSELPNDLDNDPIVDDINMSEVPIMYINMYGPYGSDTLKTFAEYLEDQIEGLEEISEVHIRGVEEKEVKIYLDKHKLQAMELNFNDVASAIDKRNSDVSGGNIKVDGVERQVMFNGQIKDLKELENLIIKQEKGRAIRLREVLSSETRIVLAEKEKESFARFEGKNVVQLEVIKGSGKNLLSASDKINKIIKASQDVKNTSSPIPSDVGMTITLDQSNQTRSQVANLENSIISGVILVVLVLLFFLGTRNSLFVGVAIPLSMFLSFMIFSMLGITINMMVLFGLIMALGMLVDNGIVVVENIYRLMDEGYTPMRAAREGVGEVAWPIIASTATTLAAFLPLAMWPGIMGEFMKYLPITLIIVLSSSLFVALVINPALTAVFMKVGEHKVNKRFWFIRAGGILLFGILCIAGGSIGWGNFIALMGLLIFLNILVLTPAANKFQNGFLPKLESAYKKLLQFALKGNRPKKFILGIVALLFFSFILLGAFTPKVVFFPDNYPRYVNVFIEKPLPTGIEPTQELALKIEDDVKRILEAKKYMPAVKALSTSVGKGTSDPGDPFAAGANTATPYKARVNIEFKEFEDREGIASQDVLNTLRDTIPILMGAQSKYAQHLDALITVDKDRAGPPTGKPVSIEISGNEYTELIEAAEDIIAIIRNSEIEGYDELKTDLDKGKLETEWEINYDLAQYLGVNTTDVSMTIRNSLYGLETKSKYKFEGDDYPIMIRLDDKYRNDMESLLNQTVTFRNQSDGQIKQIPINAITTRKDKYSFASIKHLNEKRVVTVYSNIADGYNANEVVAQLKALLADHKLKDGYTFKFTGEQEEQAKEMSFLGGALISALFLILLIIVGQFNKMSAPIIILISVLFSTIGVFLGLVIFQMDFVIIMTMIGIISLAGVVVNNAIVLLDYSELLKKRKMNELGTEERLSKSDLIEVIIESGKTRLRPVLLTAITTVLGLLPLATGLNIDFFGMFGSYEPGIYFGGDNVIFWGPMSWTIIFGITFATFLTLIIIPVMYLGVERMKYYFYEIGFLESLLMFSKWKIRGFVRLLSWITFGVIKKIEVKKEPEEIMV